MASASNARSSTREITGAEEAVTTAANALVTTTIQFPRLERVTAESIRSFLRNYDTYVREIASRASQVSGAGITTECVRPVEIKYCLDQEYLESLLCLGFIPSATCYDDLEDCDLRNYLEEQTEASKTAITVEHLDRIVKRELRMDMRDDNATSRMRNLFISYHALLRKNGIGWVIEENSKTAVRHVSSAVRPEALRTRLQSDLSLGYKHLKQDFKDFMAHCLKLSEAFQMLDVGPTSNRNGAGDKEGKSSKEVETKNHHTDKKEKKRQSRETPICLFEPHKSRGLRHFLKDCRECPEEDKKGLLENYFAERARDGPAANTRSQKKDEKGDKRDGNIGRLEQKEAEATSDTDTSCPVLLSNSSSSVLATGRCDDGSDDTIISPKIAESAAVQGIGAMRKIEPVKLQVALKDGQDAQSFTFSRTWTCPRIVLHLAAGQLALLNVRFLVADGELSEGDLIIGLPVLRHLCVDTRTLLERNRATLDGTDCAEVEGITADQHRQQVGRLLGEKSFEKTSANNANRPRANYYTCRMDDDKFPDPSLLETEQAGSEAEIVRQALENTLKESKASGLTAKKNNELHQMVREHQSVFCTTFSDGPPAAVKPLKIELEKDALPVRVKLRNYSRDQREFLKKIVADLTRCNMVYFNPSSTWACAPLLVPKSGPGKFRFTVDLRPVNRSSRKHSFLMPNVEQELHSIAGSMFYAKFDLSNGYWQFPLHEESQECQSFVTPDGVYTPTRVLHGTTNAVTYLQSTMSAIMTDELRPHVLFWLDDILLHHSTVEGLFEAVRMLLILFKKRNIKLHPGKCCFFATSIRWCGRLLSKEGIRFDPQRIEGLRHMQPPVTGAQLQQFVCALQWVKTAIPNFTSLIDPLHRFLESVYDLAGARTKRGVSKILLSALKWGKKEIDAFHRCRTAIIHQVTLAHRKQNARLCVYTDASDTFWSGIVTQIPMNDVTLPHADQGHEPLAFLSGRFNNTEMGWSVLEKEAYAVMATLERMHWMVADPHGFDLHTDHNNLIFLFDPTSVVMDLSQTTVRKVLRWAVRLSVYNYTCIHIKGPDNVWADLLGRWSAPAPTIRRLVYIPELPSSAADDFEWPNSDEIKNIQGSATEEGHSLIQDSDDSLWKTIKNQIWVPRDASDLQLRLCVIAHTGPAGHRGPKATLKSLEEKFFWHGMVEDVNKFTQGCIHCLSTMGGGRVPRPFGPSFHGTKPNDLLQFDYMELGPSGIGSKYVLMLRDDHSGYCWFFSFPDTIAENAATAIVDWAAAFGIPGALMSDGPTHFRNETVRLVTKGLRVPHHFTLPYCPWSNGSVERLGKELLRVARAVISELQMRFDEWPDLLPLFQSAINNAPSPQRGNIAPITAFTGQEPTTPISTFYRSAKSKPVTLSELQRERVLHVESFVKFVADLHPVVQENLQKHRQRARSAASRGQLPNFDVGDFVLVARSDFFAGEKLALRWRGPRRVVKAGSDYVYTVEDLRNGSKEDMHITRLKFYRDKELNSTAVMSHVLSSETGMTVSRLLRLEDTPDGLFVRIRWNGLSSDDDTLEPVERVYEDVPQLLIRLLSRKATPVHLANKARRALGLKEGGV